MASIIGKRPTDRHSMRLPVELVHEKKGYIENIGNIICYRASLFLVSGDRLYVFYTSEVNSRETVFMTFCVPIFGMFISYDTVSTSFHLSLY